MVEYDKDGNKLKVNSFGGNGDEEIDKGIYTVDGSLIFFGESDSINLGFENKGNKDDPLNYRPIALTEHIRKVFEKILLKYLKQQCINLYDFQIGFQNKKST